MPKYLSEWVDYQLPSGQDFSVAVCGYAGKVRHMYIGQDPVRRLFVRHAFVEEDFCQTGDHCLALDCRLNRAESEHLLHMLDMLEDEPADEETAKQWGTDSTLQCFIRFAHKVSESLPEEKKQPVPPVADDRTTP
jgi:hypothetical protein